MPGNLQPIPESVLASWPTPNYDDPVRRTWMPAYAGILQALTTLLLGTRFWLRIRKQAGALGLDDALLVPAYLAATMFTVLVLLGTERYSMDRHIWDVLPVHFVNIAFVGWLAQMVFLISTCSTKVSVLLFYRRLTQGTYSKKWKYATIIAIALTIAYCVAFVLVLVFNCTPTRSYWRSYDPSYKEDYHCVHTTFLNPLSGSLSVVSDFYSVVLPMGAFWQLEVTKRQRWALNTVFSIGLLVVIAGIARTYYLTRLGTHWDITWLGFDVFIWAHLEIQLALICASVPSLRVLFRRYLSEPITRAFNSGRSTGERSTGRDSRQPDSARILTASPWRRLAEDEENSPVASKGEKTLESVREIGEEPLSLQDKSVKTPGEYESVALEDLQRLRESHLYTGWRQGSSGS